MLLSLECTRKARSSPFISNGYWTKEQLNSSPHPCPTTNRLDSTPSAKCLETTYPSLSQGMMKGWHCKRNRGCGRLSEECGNLVVMRLSGRSRGQVVSCSICLSAFEALCHVCFMYSNLNRATIKILYVSFTLIFSSRKKYLLYGVYHNRILVQD